mgnify:CR=1 FL=1
MPKKNAKAQKSNELDGAEFFAAINLIEKEKGIPKAYMLEKITQALVSAYKRDHEGAGDNVTVEADEEAGTVRMFVKKDVVEEVDNPCTEMSLQMAREKLPHAQLGDFLIIGDGIRLKDDLDIFEKRAIILLHFNYQSNPFCRQGEMDFGFRAAGHGWDIVAYFPFGACKGRPKGVRPHGKISAGRGRWHYLLPGSRPPRPIRG